MQTLDTVKNFIESCPESTLSDIFDSLDISLDDMYFNEPGCNYDDVDAISEYSWMMFNDDPLRYLNNDDLIFIQENFMPQSRTI